MKKETANDWLAVIATATQKAAEVVPPGWKTMAELQKEIGLSESQTRKKIFASMKAGLVESRKFLIRTGCKIYPVCHYRIKK